VKIEALAISVEGNIAKPLPAATTGSNTLTENSSKTLVLVKSTRGG